MLSSSRGFDAFAKPIDGIRSKRTSGGIITLLAYAFATILFVSEIYLYIKVDVRHSLDLAASSPLSEVIPTDGGFSRRLLQSKNGRKKSKMSPELIKSIKIIEKNKIDLFIHVTFPYLKCENLDFAHNGAYFSTGDFSKHHGYDRLQKRKPTEYDWYKAIGESVKGKNKRKTATDRRAINACTVRGTIAVPRLSGDINISMHMDMFKKNVSYLNRGVQLDTADEETGGHNLSHYIHEITFGEYFPLGTNPLSNSIISMNNDKHQMGVNLMNVKLVPTKYKRFGRRPAETFQASVSDYVVGLETLVNSVPFVLPGLKIQYDFTPLSVHHVESRDNFFVFLSSLISIVGGVFVTVSLVSGFIVNSAQKLKKID